MSSCKRLSVPALGVALLCSLPLAGQPHPLDQLTRHEVVAAVEVLKATEKITDQHRFSLIELKEPAKSEVLAHRPGKPFRREAFVILYEFGANRTTEAVVDLNGKA